MILAHAGGTPPQGCERWLLLADDHADLARWRAMLPNPEQEVPAGAAIADAAQGLRRPFLDLMGDLGERHDSLAWWVSRVSERNTFVSPLFLHCCWLKVAVDELRRSSDGLCVVSASWAVLEAVAAEAGRAGVEARWAARRSAGDRARVAAEPFARVARFLAGGLARRLASPKLPALPPRPRVLLRTWVDDGSFSEDGAFSDRYLPGLREWLEGRGLGVLTLPVLFNVSRSHRDAWNALGAAQGEFLPDGRLLRASDYVSAIATAIRAARLGVGAVSLAGIDVTRLFEAERRRTACDEGTLDAALASRLPRRLRERGIEVDRVIQPFENLIPEKGLVWGLRRDAPGARIVGFQHTALYPLLLCQYVTAPEARVAPLPDVVVCNGSLFREVLVREGFPEQRAVVGSALRYPHLAREAAAAHGELPTERRVLVPLSLVEDVTAELVQKVRDALGERQDTEVLLKPHPMSSPAAVGEALGRRSLPPSFRLVEGALPELLAGTRVVATNASTTILETLAAGVPVAVVGRDAGLDLDPLGWAGDFARVLRDPDDLRDEIVRLLDLSPDDVARYRELGRQLVTRCFEPIDDRGMSAFLA